MKQRIQQIFVSAMLVLGLASTSVVPVAAFNAFENACTDSSSEICKAKADSVDPLVSTIVSIFLWAIGIISVIMMVVGGLKYVISAGDPSQLKTARETIIYAVVGLVVAMLAFAIVKFVVKWF